MFTLKLTVYAKPVRQLVGEHGKRASHDTKLIVVYFLIINIAF
jgi:hypothetical protein